MNISDIFQLMNIPLNDDQLVTYPADNRLDSLNAALRALASVRPDSVSRLETINLVPGALQFFPADCEQFLDLCYKIVDGLFDYPLRLVNRKDLDANDDSWCTNVGDVEEMAIDDRFPRAFWVNPTPDHDGQQIMIGIAGRAPVLASNDDVWPVPERFVQPCIEYALYWLFSRDSTVVANANRASAHLQAFTSLLGLDAQSAASVSPMTPDYKQA